MTMIDNTCYGVYTASNDKNVPQTIGQSSTICESEFAPNDGRSAAKAKGKNLKTMMLKIVIFKNR